MSFAKKYRAYIKHARKGNQFGFSLKTIASVEPGLAFLYKNWWKVEPKGLNKLPQKGAALIVGNTGGILPWPGLMLMYALMNDPEAPRRLNILCELDWIKDKKMRNLADELGFVQWSADNAKKLFAAGELVAVFPEGAQGAVKPFSERNRLRDFDWTKVLPAIEDHVRVYPMATLGCDESFPILGNLDQIAKLLEVPAFPVTPFMPFLPFPACLMSFPGNWKMHLMGKADYQHSETRNENYETAITTARTIEGEIQAEVNRLLRTRVKSIF